MGMLRMGLAPVGVVSKHNPRRPRGLPLAFGIGELLVLRGTFPRAEAHQPGLKEGNELGLDNAISGTAASFPIPRPVKKL